MSSDPNEAVKSRQFLIVGGAIAGCIGLLAAGMFMFDGEPRAAKERPKTVNITPPGSSDDRDVWRANEAARARSNETSISEVQSRLKAAEESNKRIAKELEDLRSKGPQPALVAGSSGNTSPIDGLGGPGLDRPLPVQLNPQKILSSPNGPAPNPLPMLPTAPTGAGVRSVGGLNAPINGQAPEPQPRESIEVFAFSGASESDRREPTVAAKREEKRESFEFLPGGSFVRVAMLNGVDAPTGGQAQGNPLPVAFQVLDVANLANRYRMDIKDCRFIASAWGDLSSERTMARTESLICIINGETIEMQVKGTVIGEDGKAGIRGRLVTKQGQILANALLAGTLSGIGRAFQSAATVTTSGPGGITQSIDSDKLTQAGLGGGVSQASTMLAQYYLKAADKLYPVIETDGGRVVEILVTKGAAINGKMGSKDAYRGLMHRSGGARGGDSDD